jgi:hypothetical protein
MGDMKISGGTAKGHKPLCLNCSNAMVLKGFNGEERIGCWLLSAGSNFDTPIPFPVYECSRYIRLGTPSKEAMEKTALILDGTHIKHDGFAAGVKK